MNKMKISGNKKRSGIAAAVLGMLLALSLVLPVMASPLGKTVPIQPESGNDAFTVTFTKDGDIKDDFTRDMFSLSGLQPGDTAVLTINVINENPEAADWYMLNAVLDSLEGKNKAGGENENKNTSGGAYEYRLTYQGPKDSAPVDIYNSDTVGGTDVNALMDRAEGLVAATDNLKDFFWFDNLKTGESGVVKLTIKLEGESQGNNYQDTLADLQMRFAVEIPPEPETAKPQPIPTETETPTPTTTTVPTTAPKESSKTPQTNDSMNLSLYLFIGCAAALLIIVIAVFAFRKKKTAGEAPEDNDKEGRS